MVRHAVGEGDGARLVNELLHADFDVGAVRLNRDGTVNRRHYLRLWGHQAKRVPIDVKKAFDVFDSIVAKAMEVTQEDIDNIESYLEAAFSKRTLRIKNGAIVRSRIERYFGYDDGQLKDVAGANRIFNEWNTRVCSSGYVADTRQITIEDDERIKNPPVRRSVVARGRPRKGCDAVTARVEAQLERDFANECVKLRANGRISRKAYADHLGIPTSFLSQCREIFERTERRLDEMASPTTKAVPEIRAWFIQALADGTLEVFDGGVRLRTICDRFQVMRRSFRDEVEPRQLLAWMNDEVVRLRYRPQAIRVLHDKLKEALIEPPLNRQGLTVNKTALAKALGCTNLQLKDEIVLEMIQAAEAKIRLSVSIDPFKAIINETVIVT